MIGIDTNVLVRYLAQDDPDQSARATRFMETVLTEDAPGFVSVVALVETVWVLQRAYRLPDRDVAAVVERLLQAGTLVIACEPAVFTAMIALREGVGGFADALIAALGAEAGCVHSVTFDRRALRIAGFAAL